jgi:hypothetical protein
VLFVLHIECQSNKVLVHLVPAPQVELNNGIPHCFILQQEQAIGIFGPEYNAVFAHGRLFPAIYLPECRVAQVYFL